MSGVVDWPVGCNNSLQPWTGKKQPVAPTNRLCECLLTVGTA